ncbi:WD repeat-containing protein on Y chromosome-like [Anthonomus grandis grandis]|uniref:WD repeat-containing protein on Y chromosome-like n=1 Tax=Anthonomus grandis grandis TaxID=2921223 RepID=UPI0021658B97|nr:WD repeat-containing protein on Y chromosome-like [Anthonomus grandis grandis]
MSVMDKSEIYDISLDAVEENSNQAWHSLLYNLSNSDLESLEKVFKKKLNKDGLESGLTKNEFLEAISGSYEGPQYSLQASLLFDEINRETVTWNDLLDFLIKNMYNLPKTPLRLDVGAIEHVAHGKNESIAKIVLIETEQYFCYAIILKHGRVGLYDGNLNFLTCYHAIMTREDLTRPEDERRRRNRWITDALFCPDTLMFIITNTARSLMIYEASGLNHVPYWLILSTPNILECLAYEPYVKLDSNYSSSTLYAGDCYGRVLTFTFRQPKSSLLRRKKNDSITLFYWMDFLKEKDYVTVKTYNKVHEDSVKSIKYYRDLKLLVTCSKDPNNSVILKHMTDSKGGNKVVYKIPRGVSCFALSPKNRLLITGSGNGIIRIWNIFISKPVALISEYDSEVVDIQIIEGMDLFLSCSSSAIFKLWDLKDHTCLQTLKLKFPSFRVQGKLIEWGNGCIFPGPRRKQPEESGCDGPGKTCFGISDINEMVPELNSSKIRDSFNVWQRSCILVTCCNYVAKLTTSFNEASLELTFSTPILPPPPLQNSVLIPISWRLQGDALDQKDLREEMPELNIEKQLEELNFILNKEILEGNGARSDINYKIAILESKKEKMRSKVALGSPYLALDLHDIPELQLSPDLKLHNKKKAEKFRSKIEKMLQNATYKDAVFSSPEPSSSRSRSSKSSIIDLPF